MSDEKNKLGRPNKYSPEELLKASMEYFMYCENTLVENGSGKKVPKPKTLSGLNKWLIVGKNYWYDKTKDENFSGIVDIVKNIVEEDIEEGALLGRYNPTISALNLSSNFNWRTKTEIDQKTEHSGSVNIDITNMTTHERLEYIKNKCQ